MCPTGSMWRDGRISVGQCDLVESWDNLSLSQKKNLNYRYQIGCECRVSDDPTYICLLSETLHETHTSGVSNFLPLVPDGLMCSQPNPLITLIRMCSSPQINTCYTVPCVSAGENECLWTDWLLDNSLNGEQARQYACIRRSDTTCSWYRGGPLPEKDFLDMTDPWFAIWAFILTHFRLWKSHLLLL